MTHSGVTLIAAAPVTAVPPGGACLLSSSTPVILYIEIGLWLRHVGVSRWLVTVTVTIVTGS